MVLWKHSSKFYGSNGFCYPLYIEDPYVDGWQYSAFMFLGLHTSRLVFVTLITIRRNNDDGFEHFFSIKGNNFLNLEGI